MSVEGMGAAECQAEGGLMGLLICEQCGWAYGALPGAAAQPCPHCWRGPLKPLTGTGEGVCPAAPELVIPPTLSAEELARRVLAFARSIPLAPRDLNPATLHSRLRLFYLPLWLVEGAVEATWEAEAGFHYQVVSHREYYRDGQPAWTTQELPETRLRWEPRVGQLQRHYRHIPAAALKDEAVWQDRLGPLPLTAAQPYRPELVAQALVRLPTRTPDEAWSEADLAFQAQAAEECQQAAGAARLREFRWTPAYAGLRWTLLLRPVYTTCYLDDESVPQPVWIHGQTGRVSGRRRASGRRAQELALIPGVLAALSGGLSLLLAVAGMVVPPLWGLAGAGLVVTVLLGVGAVIPLWIVWQFNRASAQD